MTLLTGRLLTVETAPVGTTLRGAAASGASTIDVSLPGAFMDGGPVQVTAFDSGATHVTEVVGSDPQASTLTLASPLPFAAPVDSFLATWPLAFERVGQVSLDDDPVGSTIPVSIPLGLWDRVAEGLRDPDDVENVVIDDYDTGGSWTLKDIPGYVPVVDGSFLDPDTVTASVIQTGASGERIVIENDSGAGVIKAYSGIVGEAPSTLNPDNYGGRPAVSLASGTVPTTGPTSAFVQIISGAGAASPANPEDKATVYLAAPYIHLDGQTVRTSAPISLVGGGWVNITPLNGFTTTSGFQPQYRLDAAGNISFRGRVNRGTGVNAGTIFTLPAALWPAVYLERVIRNDVLGTAVLGINPPDGTVRLYWTGTAPTWFGLGATFALS